jgi:hypothetical protein
MRDFVRFNAVIRRVSACLRAEAERIGAVCLPPHGAVSFLGNSVSFLSNTGGSVLPRYLVPGGLMKALSTSPPVKPLVVVKASTPKQ